MKKRKAQVAYSAAPKSNEDAADLISGLPDAILGTIISLLSTKDGGRTQCLSRHWRNLWRHAPLTLVVDFSPSTRVYSVPYTVVPKIISEHAGPTRLFRFTDLPIGVIYSEEIDRWFRSPVLANLQELDLGGSEGQSSLPLPLYSFSSASTLLVVKISNVDFPSRITTSFNFTVLKQLTLRNVSISTDVFDALLSACHDLESLSVSVAPAAASLCVVSPTLRCICFCQKSQEQELVIKDAPRLERLLMPSFRKGCGGTIRVISAPKLEILGAFSPSKLLFFQGMSLVPSSNSMCTVKVLALMSSGRELRALLNVLRWFPCLEKLYVIFYKHCEMDNKNEPENSTLLQPIKCLETHLKNVMFKKFLGNDKQIDFARYFVLNAQVVNKIEFENVGGTNSDASVAAHCELLQFENRASRDATVAFMGKRDTIEDLVNKHVHNLWVAEADPFRQP